MELIAIDDALVEEVSHFLNNHMNSPRSADDWSRAVRYPWCPEKPNYGWALRHRGQVVGVICTIYSVQENCGVREKFCNIHSWCVHPDYRSESLRLLMPLLKQDECTLTNLTPARRLVPLFKRLGFAPFDDRVLILPNLLLVCGAWHVRVSTQREAILSRIDKDRRRILSELGPMRRAVATLAHTGDKWCLCVSRRERRKGFPVTRVLYVSDAHLFSDWLAAFVRSIIKVDHTLLTQCSPRFLSRRPAPATFVKARCPELFRSGHLSAKDVTFLYSELTR